MTTLLEIQRNLDTMMTQIDNMDDISDETIDEFLGLQLERAEKIDGWIGYRDRSKFFLAEIEERKNRFIKAYSAAKNAVKRIDQRIKYHLETDKSGLAFKGKEMGVMYLQKSAPSLACMVPTKTVSVKSITDDFFLDVCKDYLTPHTYMVLDTAKVKRDLKAGVELSWATLEQSNHVRVR